jgi:lipopolysaccharide biosynthesis regulator YciM
LLLAGQRLAKAGRHAEAITAWDDLRLRDLASFALVANDYADSALACGQAASARQRLQSAYEHAPGLDLLRARARVEGHELGADPALLPYLRQQPTLSAAQAVLARPIEQWNAEAAQAVGEAVARAAKPQQRYRCAACGFEAHRYFWQCPGCLTWDSFPPRRVEEL